MRRPNPNPQTKCFDSYDEFWERSHQNNSHDTPVIQSLFLTLAFDNWKWMLFSLIDSGRFRTNCSKQQFLLGNLFNQQQQRCVQCPDDICGVRLSQRPTRSTSAWRSAVPASLLSVTTRSGFNQTSKWRNLGTNLAKQHSWYYSWASQQVIHSVI